MKNLGKFKIISGLCLAILLWSLFSCSTSRSMSQTSYVAPGIDITFDSEDIADTVYVTVSPIPTDTTLYLKEYVEAIATGKTTAFPVKNQTVHISLDSIPSVYKINCDYYKFATIYMRGSEHVDIKVNSLTPIKYDLSSSEPNTSTPHIDEFAKLRTKLFKISRHKLTEQEFDSLSQQMYSLIDKIMVESDPETATRVVSMLEDDFAPYAFQRLPAGSENTLHYTNACALRNTGNRNANQQQMLQQGIQTNAPTPEFSLPNLEGESFNINSLRGKWVVLDFWVSWCGPCKRGFKEMKKLYAEHSDNLEVVAIACGDQETTWRKLVEELELPWINLLAPAPESHDGTVAGYPISAYPTKIIIDPDGQLRDYIIGEDEEFYDRLERMIR